MAEALVTDIADKRLQPLVNRRPVHFQIGVNAEAFAAGNAEERPRSFVASFMPRFT